MAGPHSTREDVLSNKLLREVLKGATDGIQRMLDAGANIEGSRQASIKPLMAAASQGDVKTIEFMLAKGAMVDAPCTCDVPVVDGSAEIVVHAGERALHCATKSANLEAVRVLLKAGASATSPDSRGKTPLFQTAAGPGQGRWVEIARELIKAGADPARRDNDGGLALHQAASVGNVDMIRFLVSKSPRTVSASTSTSETPLYCAAMEGHDRAVSVLLGAGARGDVELATYGRCALTAAAQNGNGNVLRVLIDENMGDIGVLPLVLPFALTASILRGQAKALHILLGAEGEERRARWAQHHFEGIPMLHYAVGYSSLSAVGVLLAAGADKGEMNSFGQAARDVIGSMGRGRIPTMHPSDPSGDTGVPMRERDQMLEEATILRLLERGPALRARSWAWPVGTRRDVNRRAGGIVPSTRPLRSEQPAVLARVFSPKNDNKYFVNLVGRYAQKH